MTTPPGSADVTNGAAATDESPDRFGDNYHGTMAKHLVWDWNGTLLDDFHAVVTASSDAVIALGGIGLDADTHRERFRRPLSAFYNELLDRELTAIEFDRLNDLFHNRYRDQLADCRLSAGAIEAIGTWRGTQSLLSMWRHDELVPLVTEHGLFDYFTRVDGLRDNADVGKHQYLVDHLAQLNIEPTDTVMIGDSADDAEAAEAAGASCVLVTGGTTSRRLLAATGFPVADSLLEAVRLAQPSTT